MRISSWILFAGLIIGLCLQSFSGYSLLNGAFIDLANLGGIYGPKITSGGLWRLVGASFFHFSLLSLIVSAFGVFRAGRDVRLLDDSQFILAFIIAALVGGAVSLRLHPFEISAGAVYGVMGLYGVLVGFCLVRKRWDLLIGNRLTLITLAVLIISLFLPQAYVGPKSLAGAAAGLLAGLLMGLARGLRKRFEYSLEATGFAISLVAIAMVLTASKEPDVLVALGKMAHESQMIDASTQAFQHPKKPQSSVDYLAIQNFVRVSILPHLLASREQLDVIKQTHDEQLQLWVTKTSLEFDAMIAKGNLDIVVNGQSAELADLNSKRRSGKLQAEEIIARIGDDFIPQFNRSRALYESALKKMDPKDVQNLTRNERPPSAYEAQLKTQIAMLENTKLDRDFRALVSSYVKIMGQKKSPEVKALEARAFLDRSFDPQLKIYQQRHAQLEKYFDGKNAAFESGITAFETTSLLLKADANENLAKARYATLVASAQKKKISPVMARYVEASLVPIFRVEAARPGEIRQPASASTVEKFQKKLTDYNQQRSVVLNRIATSFRQNNTRDWLQASKDWDELNVCSLQQHIRRDVEKISKAVAADAPKKVGAL